NACRNGGTPHAGRCGCRAGFTGTCCEHGKNACENGGTPISGRCKCRAGYKGTCCEKGKAKNGVSCNDGNACTRADTCRNGICT
ncbi:predicted protein, partial [Nematostella vectensis]